MAKIDLVFEGGGAKGMVFVGALEELLDNRGHTPGRLLGTSSGAIMSTLLAAGYTVAEMQAALDEKVDDRSVFETFMAAPQLFGAETVSASALRTYLRQANLPIVGGRIEEAIDDAIVNLVLRFPLFRHLFSLVERGGWYSADPFVEWMKERLGSGEVNGQPRAFSDMTMQEYHSATNVELSLVTSDTSGKRMLILNHRTAPDLPVVWAARMSMSIPLLWQEVVWREEWGTYRPNTDTSEDISGSVLVDGGLLSNFPISLFMSNREDVLAVIGRSDTENVLGLLIDEALPVADMPPRPDAGSQSALSQLRSFQRLGRLVDTATGAHDNMAIRLFRDHVVRLPARTVGTTEFDISDARKVALIAAGRAAMAQFLDERESPLELAGDDGLDLSVDEALMELVNESAGDIVGQ